MGMLFASLVSLLDDIDIFNMSYQLNRLIYVSCIIIFLCGTDPFRLIRIYGRFYYIV